MGAFIKLFWCSYRVHFVYPYLHTGVSPAVDGDPHFMIELPDREDALCFNINDKPGTIFNLVRDPTSGELWVLIVSMTFLLLDKYKMQLMVSFRSLSQLHTACILLVDQDFWPCQFNIPWSPNPMLFPQVFWSMARSSETRRFPLMVKLTPTFGVLASSTRLWGWGWRWPLRTSGCCRMASRWSSCGLIQLVSKDPSEWLYHHLYLLQSKRTIL